MADNIAVTAGTGTNIAADDIGAGLLVQRVKTTWGPDGTANDADVATGKPLPVQLRSPTGTDMTGTAGTASAAVLTVQGIASGTAQPASIASGGVASGAVASGAVASGAIASGAVASGAVASGAFASGSIGSGAMVDVGAIADAAVTAGATGSVSAKLRSISRDLVANIVLAAGTNNIGDVDVLTIGGQTPAFGSGANGATVLRTALATDSPGIITTGTAGSASSQVLSVQGITSMTPLLATTTPAASEVHVGEVGGKSVVASVTLSTDTSAYASGDLIADTQQIDAFFRKTDGTGVINSINIIDEDAQGVALYVIFMSTSTSLGTENSAPNISDANLTAGFQGIVAVATTDYVTISGTKVATIKNIGLPVKAVSGTDDLYIAVLNATGTPTFTAAGLEMRIGALLD